MEQAMGQAWVRVSAQNQARDWSHWHWLTNRHHRLRRNQKAWRR
jgi:hypothetical protein